MIISKNSTVLELSKLFANIQPPIKAWQSVRVVVDQEEVLVVDVNLEVGEDDVKYRMCPQYSRCTVPDSWKDPGIG